MTEQQPNRRPRGAQAFIFFVVFPLVLIGLAYLVFVQDMGDYRTYIALAAAVAVNIYTVVMWISRWRNEK